MMFLKPFSRSQKGTSLVEVLISGAILTAASANVMTTVGNISEEKKIAKSSDIILERDNVVRFEIETTLDSFQHVLLAYQKLGTYQVASTCTHRVGRISVATPCMASQKQSGLCQTYSEGGTTYSPYYFLKFAQQYFLPTRPRTLYFGDFLDLKSENGIPNQVFKKTEDAFHLVSTGAPGSLVLHASAHPSNKYFIDALNRCSSQTIRRTTQSIKERSSLYICGYGENLLVELKAMFWDNSQGVSLACQDLPSKPGRSFQVLYKTYAYVKVPSQNNGEGLVVKSYTGRIFIPKRVTTEIDSDRDLWGH